MAAFEAVVGLEVHAQLRTRTKIFCGCRNAFGEPPNSRTCPVCLGHPGALPVLNRAAVELAVRAAHALGCDVQAESVFERKNYFYPDLPKGYQITQYERPLARGGAVEIEVDGASRSVRLDRLHLEEDAGKLVHADADEPDPWSGVDLNRAGTPLIEIVTRPDLRGADEAYLFLERLRSILRYIRVCDGNMEEGSLRCDANVSVRRAGAAALSVRTELKNLNSFRNVRRALEHELRRQIGVVEAGGSVEAQTVLWDAAAGTTRPMRGKEEARDYRYFPDPDLPPLLLDATALDRAAAALPELPASRKRRLIAESGIDAREAHLLTLEPELADFFEETVRLCGDARTAAAFVLNDLLRERNTAGDERAPLPFAPARLAELIELVHSGAVSLGAARQKVFPRMYREGTPPAELVREMGLTQLSDDASLERAIDSVVREHAEQVAQYRAGKQALFGFLVGRVVRATGGRANPQRVHALLRRRLDGGS